MWASENGFKFSKSKIFCMHFCHLRKAHNDPVLTLDGTPIPVVEENKLLGVVPLLMFIPHFKQLKAKCHKVLNLHRVIAHTVWVADRKVVLNLYLTIIRSKLDYCSIIYGPARKPQPGNSLSHSSSRTQTYLALLVVLSLTALWDSISIYIGPSPRAGERKDRREKNQNNPNRTYCKCDRPLPSFYPNK